MKNRSLLLAALSLALTLGVLAGDYAIDWYCIAGGGGTSTNGQYAVSGTIGQEGTGVVMTNGPFSLTGGFWVLPLAVQSSEAPTLSISRAEPGLATISWSPQTPEFLLQEATSLTPPNWTNAPSGATTPVTVPATFPLRYYRLVKP
jgi:hypothetical protein